MLIVLLTIAYFDQMVMEMECALSERKSLKKFRFATRCASSARTLLNDASAQCDAPRALSLILQLSEALNGGLGSPFSCDGTAERQVRTTGGMGWLSSSFDQPSKEKQECNLCYDAYED